MGEGLHGLIGRVLQGKYRIDGVLGEGGMGVVFAAMHLQLDQPVAIKLVRPETLGRPEIVGRMVREARASARLRSEHVVRVLDVGQLDDGSPFIVMELLQGVDLNTLIETRGPLPTAVAIDFLLQACDAIAEAHANGIVHRDLKPANLFLTNSSHGKQVIKVLDFGIAKSSRPGELTLTGAQTMMGSPAYMSPEQLRSAHTVDARTDVWSLGVILWQLCTGQVPFAADTFTELCIRIAVDPLPPVPRMPGLSSQLEAILRRSLEKDPIERFPNVVEFAQALAPHTYPEARAVAERLRTNAVEKAGDSVDNTIDRALGQREHSTGNDPSRPPGDKRMMRGALIAMGIAAASAIVMAVALPWSNSKTPPALLPGQTPPTVTPLPVPTPTPPIATVTPTPTPNPTPPPIKRIKKNPKPPNEKFNPFQSPD